MQRGAIPTPRHILAGATPHIPLEAVPAQHITIPSRLSVWHNDAYGDCVTAEEAFAKACHSPEIFITDQTVFDWASAHGVLNGASIYGVMESMQTGGFIQNAETFDDGGITSVNWTWPKVLHSAISQGPVKIGIAANQLQTTCAATGYRSGWFATGYAEDFSEDHCTSLCGYGTLGWLFGQLNMPVPAGANHADHGYAMFTWGSIGVIDVPSMLAITHEAWLRSPTTIVKTP